MFCEKGVLRNFTKFTGKHLRQNHLFFNKVAGPRLLLKFKMLMGKKIKEISTTNSYHEDKRSEKFTAICSGNYCVLKWENAQHKVENSIQSNTAIFFASSKVLAIKSTGFRAFRDTAEKEELINLMLAMH